jgi:hypothetical protein
MKIFAILLLFFLSSCQNETSTKEIIEKANRIRTELLNSKSLPAAIQKPTNQKSFSSSSREKMYDFYYNSVRKENNAVDSVLMIVTVFTDSSEHLSFHEMHLKNDKEDKSYMYELNKNGAIVWAYRTDPPTSEPTIVKNNDSMVVTPSNQPIIEINTDSANYNIHTPIKKPDEKTKAFYTAKLITSLDELDKMLSTK